MRSIRADLHIHTLLSPCADLEMTPRNIVRRALKMGLSMIGITDHNSTKNALLTQKLGGREGLFVLTGAEVTTREEVHCLVFFELPDELSAFQDYIEQNMAHVANPNGHFGYQPVVDEEENVVELIPWYLPAALDASIGEIQQMVRKLNGIFIPAHIDRPANGIISQLGFVPPSLQCDAFGLSRHAVLKHVKEHHVLQNKIPFIRNSDAHYLKQIGEIYTVFKMKEMSFFECRLALCGLESRSVELL